MSSEILPGKILAIYDTAAKMGGDEPGMVAHEVPLLAQELYFRIADEYKAGLIPPGKSWGVAIGGPITRPDGTQVTLVFKVEYDKAGV